MRRLLFVCLFSLVSVLGITEEELNYNQITYLVRAQEFASAIALYEKHYQATQTHHFEVLEQIASLTLEQGARSEDVEKRALSLFGLGLAGVSSSVDIIGILEMGIKASHLETQLMAIQFLGQLQDDRSDVLLTRAMASDFLIARLEAAYHLSLRKTRSATGQIEALMQRLPSLFRFYFSEFFAQIGTNEAISVLRHLIDDPDVQVRSGSILNAAFYGRDDLLPRIRLHATHAHLAEQEACACALGLLKDSHSISFLKKQSLHSVPSLRLSALYALYQLGETDVLEKILESARSQNLFAIALLASLPNTEPLLEQLVTEENIHVHLNAALSLLKHKNPHCVSILTEILIKDTRDLGFQPQFSSGGSLMAIKAIPSARQHQKEGPYDLHATTLQLKEQVLKECLELPEKSFLHLARLIFYSGQTELIPLLVSLLENLQTEESLALLKQQADLAGAPLLRAYCNLALFRLRETGPYEERLYDWIHQKKGGDLIRFRPMGPLKRRFQNNPFELTPEEHSRLLIESYQAVADRHDDKGINALLEALKSGKSKNRPLIAGLLLRAIQ